MSEGPERSFWSEAWPAALVVGGMAVFAAAQAHEDSYFRYLVYELPGFQYLWELVVPPIKHPFEDSRDAPSIVIWLGTVYTALFYLAYNKYIDRVRTIEGQANALITQITASLARDDNTPFQDLARVQHMWCYPKPRVWRPWSVWRCLSAKEPTGRSWRGTPIDECHMPVVEQLKGVVENHRTKLEKAILAHAFLQKANLTKANLQGAGLWRANLQEANLTKANLQGADLWRANLQGAKLWQANLQGAALMEANLQGADLGAANLQGAEYIRPGQVLDAAWCQDIQLDADLAATLEHEHGEQWRKVSADLSGARLVAWNSWRTALLAARKEGKDIKPWWEWFEDYKKARPKVDWEAEERGEGG